MKKALLLLTVFLVALLTLSSLALYAVMQTRYAPNVITYLGNSFTPYQVKADQVEYHPPLQLVLHHVQIEHQQQQVQLPKLTLWLSQRPWQNHQLAFDSMLIEGAHIQLSEFAPTLFDHFVLHQLALKHVDIDAGKWSARGVNVQVKKPKWQSEAQRLPYGDIQLSVDQLYMQGEALDDLLVDIRYQAKDSTIFGSSFVWREANISGQAEQYDQGWSLVNVTIDQLNLPKTTHIEQLTNTLSVLDLPIYHINSLDILGSSFNYGSWRFEQLDASLESINLNQSLWQQQSGYASFDAESINHLNLALLSPTARVMLKPNELEVEEFDADIKQGRAQLAGTITPDSIALSQLRVSGVKWLEDTDKLLPELSALTRSLRNLTIDQLDIENAQLIQVETVPYWQVSGLNIDGSQLSLIQQDKVGLLEGKLELSANAASIDTLITTQVHIAAHASDNKVTLDRAFIPLEQGYIEANGEWQRGELSAPWQLMLHADGLPLEHYLAQETLPVSLTGFVEAEVELQGLSGDYAMLAHSLSGHARLSFHQATLEAMSLDGKQTFQQPLTLNDVEFSADRGRVTATSADGPTQIAGEVDLTKPQYATLLLKSQHDCQELWSDLILGANVIKQTCAANHNKLEHASQE